MEIYTTSEKNLLLRRDGKANDNFKMKYRIEIYISKFQISEKKTKKMDENDEIGSMKMMLLCK
jgi:hypothetical protein